MTGPDYVVACVIATEVPPKPTGEFTAPMIPVAIRAVADVIRNRVKDSRFPDTAVEVVLQPKQFSAVCREAYWRAAMAGGWFPGHVASCLKIWEANQPPLAIGALYYYSPVTMVPPHRVPSWVAGLDEVLVPGIHRDYFRFYGHGA